MVGLEGVRMTAEMIEARVSEMDNDIKEIKADIKEMPDKISAKINENIDIKIRLAITETEKKYQGKFISLLLAVLAEGAGLIFSFFKG